MYSPTHFSETDVDQLCQLIEHHPFGMLITAPNGQPFVSHLPFLLDRQHNKIYGHLARANPQSQHLASGCEALAVFQGSHAFVSPHWYSSPGVPTWNYAVAHVRNNATLIEDTDALSHLVTRMTGHYDSHGDQSLVSAEQYTSMLDRIVGFSLDLTGLSGKFKLSQNRARPDQISVAAALAQSANPIDQGMASLMTQKLGLNHE